jgi:glycosyltransferase involved in cell wall biosynthesis
VIVFREPGAARPEFPADVRSHTIDLPHHGKDGFSRAARNIGRAVRGVPPLVDRFSGFNTTIERIVSGRHFDLGVIEHFWCAPYAGILRPHCARLLLDLHNIESVLLDRCGKTGPPGASVLMRRFASVCSELERVWLPRFDSVLVTSEADREHAGDRAIVYPNAVPHVPLPVTEKRDEIVFSGNLGYQPNIAGVRWFRRNVWPLLARAHPQLRWRLVGKNEAAVRRLVDDDDRIVLTGPVADAVQELARTRLAVVPVISGSGTRTKIIEAWAAGLPVVSTTIGAEGLPYTDGEHVLVADAPHDFAAKVGQVLADEHLQKRLGRNGRALYEERLTWEAAWRVLEHAGL